MVLALLILVAEAAGAFLSLDLCFRYIPVEPDRLRERLERYAFLYTAVAVAACGAGALLQRRAAGGAGLLVAAFDWLPWWLLWRFGLRKQFTYLFKSDGGHSAGTQKPDP